MWFFMTWAEGSHKVMVESYDAARGSMLLSDLCCPPRLINLYLEEVVKRAMRPPAFPSVEYADYWLGIQSARPWAL